MEKTFFSMGGKYQKCVNLDLPPNPLLRQYSFCTRLGDQAGVSCISWIIYWALLCHRHDVSHLLVKIYTLESKKNPNLCRMSMNWWTPSDNFSNNRKSRRRWWPERRARSRRHPSWSTTSSCRASTYLHPARTTWAPHCCYPKRMTGLKLMRRKFLQRDKSLSKLSIKSWSEFQLWLRLRGEFREGRKGREGRDRWWERTLKGRVNKDINGQVKYLRTEWFWYWKAWVMFDPVKHAFFLHMNYGNSLFTE